MKNFIFYLKSKITSGYEYSIFIFWNNYKKIHFATLTTNKNILTNKL